MRESTSPIALNTGCICCLSTQAEKTKHRSQSNNLFRPKISLQKVMQKLFSFLLDGQLLYCLKQFVIKSVSYFFTVPRKT
jgi:hypothetical protein